MTQQQLDIMSKWLAKVEKSKLDQVDKRRIYLAVKEWQIKHLRANLEAEMSEAEK